MIHFACITFTMSRSLDGLGVAFQVLMPEDSGSNPEAGSIYLFDEVCPGLGLLQPQWNPYPNLHPASYWDPPIVQSWPSVWFGSLSPLTAKWQATSAAEPNLRVTSTQLGWVSNDGNPSHTPTFPLHFFHRWRPSGGSWCCTTTHLDAIYNIHPT